MKITLVISSLGSGGAERAMCGLANYWAREGHEVTLITFSSSADFYAVDTVVSRVRLGLQAASRNGLHAVCRIARRWWHLRRAIAASRPGVVLSFVDKTNVMTLLACAGLRLRVVVAERTNPEHYVIPRGWALLRDVLYRRASALVVQTDTLRAWARARIRPDRVHVIPNVLDRERLTAILAATDLRDDPCWDGCIVAVGRMTTEKGHDLLLNACAPVFVEFPRWRLKIVGEGPLRCALQAQANLLGIANNVYFCGQLPNPFDEIKRADIFVLPSRVEGFPNVLLEAMAAARACISFDCPSGPSALIDHRNNGLLVPAQDVAALEQAMRLLITKPDLREQLGREAAGVTRRFSESAIMRRWSEVLRV